MSGWLILGVLAVLTFGGLMLVARPARGAVELLAAVMLLAVAGYAWQGNPSLVGKPTPPRANHPAEDSLFASERGAWMDRMGGDAQVLDTADALFRNGDPAYAVGIVRGAVGRKPDSMMLWLGLGNALVTYADGAVTPPGRYAFERAGGIAPNDPAPAYFLALAYAQSGDLDTAERIWRNQLARAPADAPWRGRVTEKLILLDRARSGG